MKLASNVYLDYRLRARDEGHDGIFLTAERSGAVTLDRQNGIVNVREGSPLAAWLKEREAVGI